MKDKPINLYRLDSLELENYRHFSLLIARARQKLSYRAKFEIRACKGKNYKAEIEKDCIRGNAILKRAIRESKINRRKEKSD